MNTKMIYSKPRVEVLEVELEGVIADSPGTRQIGVDNSSHEGGVSRAKGFWE